MAALRVVADGVARAQTDPVRQRAVGLAQVAHEALHTESLVRRHCDKNFTKQKKQTKRQGKKTKKKTKGGKRENIKAQ